MTQRGASWSDNRLIRSHTRRSQAKIARDFQRTRSDIFKECIIFPAGSKIIEYLSVRCHPVEVLSLCQGKPGQIALLKVERVHTLFSMCMRTIWVREFLENMNRNECGMPTLSCESSSTDVNRHRCRLRSSSAVDCINPFGSHRKSKSQLLFFHAPSENRATSKIQSYWFEDCAGAAGVGPRL